MKLAIIFFAAICLSACGTKLPSLAGGGEEQLFVEDVHRAIQCEIIDAIHEANAQAAFISRTQPEKVDFFEEWGVKYTLTLNVVEDSTLNPSFNILNPTTAVDMLNPGDSVFTLGAEFKHTAKATRTETDQVFNTVDFIGAQRSCDSTPASGRVIFGNDIGVMSWLLTRLGLVQSGLITSISEKESFTYQVKFEIGASTSITPKWAFVKRELADIGPDFGVGRTSSHSVLITFGPVSKTRSGLARDAEAIHNARLISLAINQ